MDSWTVYVEVDGQEIWSATYGDIGAAQVAAAGKELDYYWHRRAGVRVAVGIAQS
jgi:hypothetical protein